MSFRLDHCCLNVRDMDRAIRFYQEHFNMKLLGRRPIPENNAEIAYVGYEENGMKVELTHWGNWKPEDYVDDTNFDHIAIIVPDTRALVEKLRAAGVEIAKEPYSLSNSKSVIAFVKDLDGNWVELIQKG